MVIAVVPGVEPHPPDGAEEHTATRVFSDNSDSALICFFICRMKLDLAAPQRPSTAIANGACSLAAAISAARVSTSEATPSWSSTLGSSLFNSASGRGDLS